MTFLGNNFGVGLNGSVDLGNGQRGVAIVTAANAQIGLGIVGAAGSLAAEIAPALADAEEARSLAARLIALIGAEGWLSAALPWIGAAVFAGVILYALKARKARIEDHRSGRTP